MECFFFICQLPSSPVMCKDFGATVLKRVFVETNNDALELGFRFLYTYKIQKQIGIIAEPAEHVPEVTYVL